MPVLEVTDRTFETEVLRSELPVLVDLYADWCQPCKQLSPLVEEVAGELAGKLKVVKVDVDRSPGVAHAFRVQSIPTLALIAGGRVVDLQQGLLPKAAILEMVQAVLPADASEVKPPELAALVGQGRAVPIDIRDAVSFARARIPGAVNVPRDDLTSRAGELRPTDGRVRVLYDRTTAGAKEAAEALREQGLDVAFLDGGLLHWEADGLPIERAS
ncbi:MAG: thioredoxin [Sandaracinaceae bacterium]|nr:thioredoxin [Sandaracinaceae bacterium]